MKIQSLIFANSIRKCGDRFLLFPFKNLKINIKHSYYSSPCCTNNKCFLQPLFFLLTLAKLNIPPFFPFFCQLSLYHIVISVCNSSFNAFLMDDLIHIFIILFWKATSFNGMLALRIVIKMLESIHSKTFRWNSCLSKLGQQNRE